VLLDVLVDVVEEALNVHLVQPLDGLRRSGSRTAVGEGEDVEGLFVDLELCVRKRHQNSFLRGKWGISDRKRGHF
tara:strand:- start:620 stop:844 length:225 start_codon:yes stop_codon:yes gene_type:complete